jgi:hypothetical protein
VSPFIRKLAASGSWVLSIEALNWFFDYPLYAFVILKLGAVEGGTVMTILALILNYSLVRVYSKSKHDWYGFEWLKLQAAKGGGGLLGPIMRMGKVPAFVFLSWRDPFKAYIFVRGKRGIVDAPDWIVFLGANVLGNVIHTALIGSGISIIKQVIF